MRSGLIWALSDSFSTKRQQMTKDWLYDVNICMPGHNGPWQSFTVHGNLSSFIAFERLKCRRIKKVP